MIFANPRHYLINYLILANPAILFLSFLLLQLLLLILLLSGLLPGRFFGLPKNRLLAFLILIFLFLALFDLGQRRSIKIWTLFSNASIAKILFPMAIFDNIIFLKNFQTIKKGLGAISYAPQPRQPKKTILTFVVDAVTFVVIKGSNSEQAITSITFLGHPGLKVVHTKGFVNIFTKKSASLEKRALSLIFVSAVIFDRPKMVQRFHIQPKPSTLALPKLFGLHLMVIHKIRRQNGKKNPPVYQERWLFQKFPQEVLEEWGQKTPHKPP